jgi:hypothetical protein
VFGKKVLRKIYGPPQDNGAWRIRFKDELCALFEEQKLTAAINIGRLTPGWSNTVHGSRLMSS